MNNGLQDFRGILNYLIENVRMMKRVDSSVMEVNKIRRGKVDGIRLNNCYIKRYVMVGCVLLLVMWRMCFLFMKVCFELISLGSNQGIFLMAVMILTTLVVTLILGRILLYTYRYMDECYLTEDGIVSIPILFKQYNSKFRLEKNYDGGIAKTYIKVIYTERYKDSNWRFEVLEREKDVEEIIKKFR